MAPKMKGIVAQSVKEVLQSLVDDDLVVMEKIGTSNYFWSFPSSALQIRRNKINQLNKEVQQLQQQLNISQPIIMKLENDRQDTEERLQLQYEFNELEQTNRILIKELEKYRELDPDIFEAKKSQLEQISLSINRWTENTFILQSYCNNKFNINKNEFAIQFEIPEDMDYVEC